MRRIGRLLLVLFIAHLPYVARAGDEFKDLIGASGVYTLVNLHPDEQRAKLYAVNYQQSGLIPLCTEVVIKSLKRKRMTFEVKKTGKTYYYDNHKSTSEPFPVHLARYFGKSCPKDEVSRLSKVDRDGIRSGVVRPGMSRQAVIYAIGYPPLHATPDRDVDRWRYWTNRFNTIMVVFDPQGNVLEIRE